MQSLPAELVELYLPGEVAPDDVLDLFADWWLKRILIDPIEIRNLIWNRQTISELKRFHEKHSFTPLTEINTRGSSKEPGNVLLQHRQGGVKILQNTHHSVLTLHRVLGSLQGPHCVEGPAKRNRAY